MDSETESISSQDEQNLTSSDSEEDNELEEEDDDELEEVLEEDLEEQNKKDKQHNKKKVESDSEESYDDSEISDEEDDMDNIDDSVIDNDIIDVDSKIVDKNCLYKYVNNISETPFEIKYITGNDRITKPFMTKYEKVRVLGIRTQQLASGAKPMVKDVTNLTPYEISKLELKMKMLPLIIQRPLPNGNIEQWKVQELSF